MNNIEELNAFMVKLVRADLLDDYINQGWSLLGIAYIDRSYYSFDFLSFWMCCPQWVHNEN